MANALALADAPRGVVVTVIAPPESGKSSLLWHWYVKHQPRIITIDVEGESKGRDANAILAFGLEETKAALRDCVGRDRWHVGASLERDEIEELFWILCPHRRSEATIGFGKAVGGVAVMCDELLAMAPNGLGKNSRVKAAYLRYRHNWLSLFGATQHAPDCDPCTRGGRIVALRTLEDLSLQAIARATSREIADRVAELPQFHSVTCLKNEARAYVADDKYRVYDVLDYRGRPVAGDASTLTAGLSPAAAQSASDERAPAPAARQRHARA